MKPALKILNFSESLLLFHERMNDEIPFEWHYHPEFELVLIVKGHGSWFIGNSVKKYGPGDLILIGSNIPHGWHSACGSGTQPEEHLSIILQFRESLLTYPLFHTQDMEPVRSLLERSGNGLVFGPTVCGKRAAKKLRSFPELSPGRRLIEFLSVLMDLAEETSASQLSTGPAMPPCRPVDRQRIETIVRYLQSHYTDEIDFVDLARHIGMDQTALCRFFRRVTGSTMTAYVNELRVSAASQMLRDTDLSILDIGFRVGFGNYSNFNRQFQRIKGYSPRVLRDQFPAARISDGSFQLKYAMSM